MWTSRTLRVSSLLALVVLPLVLPGGAAAGGGSCRGVPTTEGSGDEVTMSAQDCFEPTVLNAAAGRPVTWANEGATVHTVTGAGAEWGNYAEYGSGQRVSHTFSKPGVYPYYCLLHPGMIGAIVVSDGQDVVASQPVPEAVPTVAPPAAGTGVAQRPADGQVENPELLGAVLLAIVAALGGGWIVHRRHRTLTHPRGTGRCA